MGWLCSRCGTENRFREKNCRACRSSGSLLVRSAGECISLWERCGADRLGAFNESRYERIVQGVGRANGAADIGICVAMVCCAALVLLCCFDHAGSGILVERLAQLGQTFEELMQRADANIGRISRGAVRFYEAVPEAVGAAAWRLGQLADAAGNIIAPLPDRAAENVRMLWRGMEDLGEAAGEWLEGASDAVRNWAEMLSASGLGALIEWMQTAWRNLTDLVQGLF